MENWESKENWFINESELDDDQYDVKKLAPEVSYVIKGGAGSGKTVLALWRAVELTQNGQQATVIVYTGALKKFIQAAMAHNPLGVDIHVEVVSEYQWRKDGRPTREHLIIDEAQDFSADEIAMFQASKSMSIALFGDSAQQLYSEKPVLNDEDQELRRVPTMTVEQIAELLGLPLRVLRKNHRLSKKNARFAQYLSSNSEPLENNCVKEGERPPTIIKCGSKGQEIDAILQIIKSMGLRDVGILLPNNTQVEEVYNAITARGVACEFKTRKGQDRNTNMNFASDNPKVLTYHSAKGLQFQTVFMPYASRVNNSIWQKPPVYVASTRASQQLYLTYSDALHPFFTEIPNEVYISSQFAPEAIGR